MQTGVLLEEIIVFMELEGSLTAVPTQHNHFSYLKAQHRR